MIKDRIDCKECSKRIFLDEYNKYKGMCKSCSVESFDEEHKQKNTMLDY